MSDFESGLWDYAALREGARQWRQQGSLRERGWQPMNSAPRDGTIIEIACTYGLAPWYRLHRWTNEMMIYAINGPAEGAYIKRTVDRHAWINLAGTGGPFDESSLLWRPYDGRPEDYVDPTGGLQDSAAYSRGAVAASGNMPIDALEAQAARNFGKSAAEPSPLPARLPWWARWGARLRS